ncbi:MAG TPA: hypothetical protein VK249_24505 [Anaerolineales bacterium]|nr:hypothetical protein [Anaerolineales bacterium]
MNKIIHLISAFILASALLTTTGFTPSQTIDTPTPTPTSELGLIKICKVAGQGVEVGQAFTIKVEGNSYSVPAGPKDGGYCVLAGQYPVGTHVTVQEVMLSGYYLSRIDVKPERTISKNLAEGSVIVKAGSGVTEVLFTNNVIGSPTPTRTSTPLVTNTPKPTRTSTATPDCGANCTPTSTPVPRGRLQICKEADGAGVTGYFTFRFARKSVTVPVGACSGLIAVDAGSLTITEDPQTGYSVTNIDTIPAGRLISADPSARSATVTIVEGTVSSQTIVIFSNQAVTQTATPTDTPTSTSTDTATATTTSTTTATSTATATGTLPTDTPTDTPTATATSTATATGTAAVCQPVTPDFSQVPVGASVEGLGKVNPNLNINALGTAAHILEGKTPMLYSSIVNGVGIINGGMITAGGFSDPVTQAAGKAQGYTFTFAPGLSVNSFSLHMSDYGDFNPTNSTNHLVTMTAYDINGAVVASQELSYTTTKRISSQYGDLLISGDALTASPGQPGNWTWHVSGDGIVRVVLTFGVGYDPNIGFDLLTFSSGNCTP